MKTITIALALLMPPILATAQKVAEKEIPAAVKSSLNDKYPNAKNIKWELENSVLEAEFRSGNMEHSVLFDQSGKILETEITVSAKKLPANAVNYINAHFPGKKIKEAAIITGANSTVTYEAEIFNKDLIFDQDGNFIKEVIE